MTGEAGKNIAKGEKLCYTENNRNGRGVGKMIETQILGIPLCFETGGGVFSPGGVDTGTLAMLEKAELKPGDKVLDLGCGYGPVGLYAAKRLGGDSVVLCDISQEAVSYARENAARNALYRDGKKIEILVNYNPKLHYFGEWWKQLYGESEGKDGKGIFPAAVDNSTDLHSMGQWIQDGERSIFETVLSVENPDKTVVIPSDEANLDGLNYIAGKRVDEVNKMAELGTRIAHVDGGVPNMRITIPALKERYLGELIYFFEIACGISGYMLGVNPFNQPGVEAYKKNMFALLAKPGYEKETEAIKSRLG